MGREPPGRRALSPSLPLGGAQQQAMLFLLTGEVFDTSGGLPCLGVRTSG